MDMDFLIHPKKSSKLVVLLVLAARLYIFLLLE